MSANQCAPAKLARGAGCLVPLLLLGLLGGSAEIRAAGTGTTDETAVDVLPVVSPETVLGDTGAPYDNLFQNVTVGAKTQPKIGPMHTDLNLRLLQGPRMNLPMIDRGFRSENADLKLGRFYLDVKGVSGSLLYSDNARQDNRRKESGVIGIARLDLTASLQATEGLQLAVGGSLVWLPFSGDFGVAGFGINDPTLLLLTGIPVFRSQASARGMLMGWNLELVDDFTVSALNFGEGLEGFDIYEGEIFDGIDRLGNYTRTYRGGIVRPVDVASRSLDTDLLLFRNRVGASVDRLLPTETRAEASFQHMDFWYSGNSRGLPRSINVAKVGLASERENLRFKPFINHIWRWQDTREGVDQITMGGIAGPISDYLNFLGEFGYFNPGDSDRTRNLWKLRLQHNPRDGWEHFVQYQRGVAEPDLSIRTMFTYQFRKVIGPNLDGIAQVQRGTIEDPKVSGNDVEFYIIGGRLVYDWQPRGNWNFNLNYQQWNYDDPVLGESTVWNGMIGYYYNTFTTSLIWRNISRQGAPPGRVFDENLILLNVGKRF